MANSWSGSRISTRPAAGPSSSTAIFEDLRWLGLEWDEPVLVQSQRAEVYAEALERLRDRGLVYPCFCTRADIAAALEAPHGAAGAHYPGTCRGLRDDPERRETTPHSWRLDAEQALALTGIPSWREHDRASPPAATISTT